MMMPRKMKATSEEIRFRRIISKSYLNTSLIGNKLISFQRYSVLKTADIFQIPSLIHDTNINGYIMVLVVQVLKI